MLHSVMLSRDCSLTEHVKFAAGVSAHAHKNWGTDYESNAIFVRSVSLVLMVLSIFMAIYAAFNFYYRGEMLQCVFPSSVPLLPFSLGHLRCQQLVLLL